MENLEEKRYWIWLSLIPNLGSRKIQALLECYKNPKTIYELKEKELLKIKGIGEKTIENILDKSIRTSVEKHIQYMLKNNIDIISIKDKEYPSNLKEIYDPPISLYVKGNKTILRKKAIAIVGCREVSQYGKRVAKYFSYHLAKRGINIISGLAKGVDSYAHIGAICGQMDSYSQMDNRKKSEDCGKTIAVLGSGLNRIYPKENEELANQIIEKGGTILSEYPLRYETR